MCHLAVLCLPAVVMASERLRLICASEPYGEAGGYSWRFPVVLQDALLAHRPDALRYPAASEGLGISCRACGRPARFPAGVR